MTKHVAKKERALPREIDAEYMALLKEKPYLSPTEAAALVSKSRNTIYDAIYSGELDFIAQGHRYVIKRSALDEWMEQRGAPRRS